MSTYKIKEVEFLTQMPDNHFKGNPQVNARLQKEWRNNILDCSEQDAENHLDFIVNFIEDNCGMLVGHVTLECLSERDPNTPSSWREDMPSLSGRYPKGWVWERKATLIN